MRLKAGAGRTSAQPAKGDGSLLRPLQLARLRRLIAQLFFSPGAQWDAATLPYR